MILMRIQDKTWIQHTEKNIQILVVLLLHWFSSVFDDGQGLVLSQTVSSCCLTIAVKLFRSDHQPPPKENLSIHKKIIYRSQISLSGCNPTVQITDYTHPAGGWGSLGQIT